MDRRRVLDDHHVLALHAAEAQLGNRCSTVFKQPAAIIRIGPSPRDDFGAVEWPDFFLLRRHHAIDHIGCDQPLFDQQRFNRLCAQGGLRHGLRVVMAFAVVVIAHRLPL
jgi:hypothetical protein